MHLLHCRHLLRFVRRNRIEWFDGDCDCDIQQMGARSNKKTATSKLITINNNNDGFVSILRCACLFSCLRAECIQMPLMKYGKWNCNGTTSACHERQSMHTESPANSKSKRRNKYESFGKTRSWTRLGSDKQWPSSSHYYYFRMSYHDVRQVFGRPDPSHTFTHSIYTCNIIPFCPIISLAYLPKV